MARHFPKKAIHRGNVRELRCVFCHNFLDVSAIKNHFVPQIGVDFYCADYSDDNYTKLKEIIEITRILEAIIACLH